MVRTSFFGSFAIVMLAVVTGCGSDDNSAAPSTASPGSAAPTTAAASPSPGSPPASPPGVEPEYSSLLIKASDIGPDAWADGPPIANPAGVVGVGQTFKNPDGKRTIVVTLAVFADPSEAAHMVPAMRETLSKKVAGEPQPVDVGSDGLMVAGVASEKSMEVSEVVFTAGKVLVDLEFDSSLGNPTPPDVVLDVARKQDAAVRNGLPS
ncbi:hypothetical protein [Mycobacterium decipiens]|nr:hypothetical protein [Mycobacterium decipiens]